MLADLPFKICFRMAVTAGLTCSIDRHGGLGMISIDRAVAGLAGNTFALPRLRVRIVTGRVALHTFGRIALRLPSRCKITVGRGLAVLTMLPGILVFSMAHHAIR